MLFNSIDFVLFLLFVIVGYYLIPVLKGKKYFLLLTSYYYYLNWEPGFLFLLLLDTIISYSYGRISISNWFENRKKIVTGITISLLLLPLFLFKYLTFLNIVIFDVLTYLKIDVQVLPFQLLLPIGISFYTFQSIGYVMDVYKKKQIAESDILDYALFIGFFPQISAGPIGRAPILLPQFKVKHDFEYDSFVVGLKMMLWGFFMKLVVGDRAGIYVDTIFSNYEHHSGLSLLLATFLYSIQIYCDFAGYSLIAIGTGRLLGFRLQTNFERPYFALNMTDFWRRWHISLSTWFRDYLYIPLGGNRCGKWKNYRNILITFLISGLWHGAAYTFIIWGFLHGIFQIVGKLSKSIQSKFYRLLMLPDNSIGYKIINIILTFILASYAWMIFRAGTLENVIGITKGYFRSGSLYVHQTTLFFFFIGFIFLLLKDLKDEYFPEKHYFLYSEYLCIRYLSTLLLICMIVLFGVLDGGQFIYFQF